MADIETQDERDALQAATEQIAATYPRPVLTYERLLIRLGWLAGRDWARNQEMLAQIEEQRRRAELDLMRDPRGVKGAPLIDNRIGPNFGQPVKDA